MADKEFTLGSLGPFKYDDGVFPAALDTEGTIRAGTVPSGSTDVLRLDDVGGGGAVAPSDAEYVVVSLEGDLSAERVLAVNVTNLTLTDGGANGNITLNTIQNIDVTATPQFAGITLSAIPAGVDNSVLVSVAGVLSTDEIDSRVWGASLVAASGTPTAGHIPYFTAANTITMDSGQLFWDAANNRLGTGIAVPLKTLHVYNALGFNTQFRLERSGQGHYDLTLSGERLVFVDTDGVQSISFGTPGGSFPEVIFNNSGADLDFRIESDLQTHAFFVDAGNDRIGIFESAPSYPLDIGGDARVQGKLLYDTATELTIASGIITVTQNYHRVDTEGDAASDDLATIDGGVEGMILVLKAENNARTVVCQDTVGNLLLAGDFSLDSISDSIVLIYDGTSWLEVSRSDNG